MIARNRNTYAKRQREMEKKTKAEAKRIRRNNRKQGGGKHDSAELPEVESNSLEVVPHSSGTTPATESEDERR